MEACPAGTHEFESGEVSITSNPMYQGALIHCRRCQSGHLMEIVQESPFDGKHARVYLRLFSQPNGKPPARDIVHWSIMCYEETLEEMRRDGVQVVARNPTSGRFADQRLVQLADGGSGSVDCLNCGHAPADHESFRDECLACVWCEKFLA